MGRRDIHTKGLVFYLLLLPVLDEKVDDDLRGQRKMKGKDT